MIARIIHAIAAIWRENMLGYLPLDIICFSTELTVFLELSSRNTIPFSKQIKIADKIMWEQGWRSGESTRLPPLWPGFDSRTWRHMWVEFVVGSRPSSEGFPPGSPVFLPPQKSTLLNSNLIWNQ